MLKNRKLRPTGVLATRLHETRLLNPRTPFRLPNDGREPETVEVLTGLLALYTSDAWGRQIVGLRFPGEAVLPNHGSVGLWPLTHSNVAISTQPPNEADMEFIDRQLRSDIAIATKWLSLDSRPKPQRLAHLLCEMSVRGGYGDTIPWVISQQAMAEATAQTSVNANRVLRELTELGLIERDGRIIRIPDWQALAAFAGFEPSYLKWTKPE